MADIFLSYDHRDALVAEKVAQALSDSGWSVWWDPKIRFSGDFDQAIEQQLEEARCVLTLWSVSSVSSNWVRAEAARALDRGKLVHVYIQPVELPLAFSRLQAMSLVNWDYDPQASDFRRLIEGMTAYLREPDDSLGEAKPGSAPLVDGDRFRDYLSRYRRYGPELVVVPSGGFMMGSPETEPEHRPSESPLHQVTFEYPFGIGRYPVTFEEYDLYCTLTGHKKPDDRNWGRARRPVINVSWMDASEYCDWLSSGTQESYRLPTESEWEYSCRGGTATSRWWGSDIEPGRGNCGGHYGPSAWRGTSPVNAFGPNPFGLFDMLGNVWEWVEDSYCGTYENAPRNGTAWVSRASEPRIIRGGSWGNACSDMHAARRGSGDPLHGSSVIGFRVARSI